MIHQISRYTEKIKVSYQYNDAMNYLYHNGDISVNSDQKKFLSNCSKTTICSHLRFIHGLSWFASPLLLKAILYAISDAKMIVQYLKEVKYNEIEPNWSDDWWTCVFNQRDVYSPDDTHDPFWRSNIKMKNKNITAEDLQTTLTFLKSFNPNDALIYSIYKFMYEEVECVRGTGSSANLRHEIKILILESLYLRRRLDCKMLEYQSTIQ